MRLEDILLSGENMQPATRKVVHRSPAHTVRLLNLPHLQDEAIEADSSVERDFVHCAALFTLTRAIKAQPFKLSLKASSYTPDFAVKFADGYCAVVEVKPEKFVDSYQELFAHARRQLAERGMLFFVVRDTRLRHGGLMERALIIRRYAKGVCRLADQQLAKTMVAEAGGTVSIMSLREAGVPLEVILYLVAHRQLMLGADLRYESKDLVYLPNVGEEGACHALQFGRWLDI